jgi:hypothetical protein
VNSASGVADVRISEHFAKAHPDDSRHHLRHSEREWEDAPGGQGRKHELLSIFIAIRNAPAIKRGSNDPPKGLHVSCNFRGSVFRAFERELSRCKQSWRSPILCKLEATGLGDAA